MLLIFIILDLFWSGAAWVYDMSKLTTIPPYLWLFVAVCPIYPLLIALILLQLYLKKSPNQFLLAFGAIPSVVFGVLALIFYPTAMFYQGFSWNGLGQIFWVLFYALQGVWLLRNFKIKPTASITASLFTAFLLFFQFFSKSYGYFDFSNIPIAVLSVIVVVGLFSIFFLNTRRMID